MKSLFKHSLFGFLLLFFSRYYFIYHISYFNNKYFHTYISNLYRRTNCCVHRLQRFIVHISIQFIKSLTRERSMSIHSIYRNVRIELVGKLDNKRYMLDIDTWALVRCWVPGNLRCSVSFEWRRDCFNARVTTTARQWWRWWRHIVGDQKKKKRTEDGGGFSWSFGRLAKNAMPPWRASWHNGMP